MKPRFLFLLLAFYIWRCPENLAQETNGAEGHPITVQDYSFFLSAVASNDNDHLYDEKMVGELGVASIVRSGAPGSYCYKAGGWRLEAEDSEKNATALPVTFLSYNDVVQYCQWKNSATSTSTFHFNCCASSCDQELKSNILTFCIASSGATASQASGVGTAFMTLSNEELLADFALAVCGVGVTRNCLEATERDPTHESNLQRPLLTRSFSEGDLQSTKRITDENVSLRKINSMNDLNLLNEQRTFSFSKKSASIEPAQSQKEMNTTLSLAAGSLSPGIKHLKTIQDVHEQGELEAKLEGKKVELSDASYDHGAAREKSGNQNFGVPEEKSVNKKVTFTLPQSPDACAEPFVLCGRVDYEAVKGRISTQVQEIEKNISEQSYQSLLPDQQQSLLQRLSEECDNAIELLKMASRTLDPQMMEPIKKIKLSTKPKKQTDAPKIIFPSKHVKHSDAISDGDFQDDSVVKRANFALNNLQNIQSALLADEPEVGAALLNSQRINALQIWKLDVSEELYIRLKNNDLFVCPAKTAASTKRKDSYQIYKECKESLPIADSLQARRATVEESLHFVGEALNFSDQLVEMLERRKK